MSVCKYVLFSRGDPVVPNHATHAAVSVIARDYSSALPIVMVHTAFRNEPLPLCTKGSPHRPWQRSLRHHL